MRKESLLHGKVNLALEDDYARELLMSLQHYGESLVGVTVVETFIAIRRVVKE